MPVAGESLLIDIDPLEDADGNLITDGAAFLFADIVFTAPGSTTATPVTPTAFTHLGSGRYRATIASGSTGRYSGRIRYVRSGVPVQSWTWAEDVLAVAGIAVSTPTVDTSAATLHLYQGDDYNTAEVRSLQFAISGAPDLSTASSKTFRIATARGTKAIVEATYTVTGSYPGTQTVVVNLTAAQTNLLTSARYKYDIRAVISSRDITIGAGSLDVVRDVTGP